MARLLGASRQTRDRSDKRLWMVNHYAVTPEFPGGTRHLDLGVLLSDSGWSTTIFASAFNHNSHSRVRKGRMPWSIVRETIEGVDWEWIPSFPYQRNDWRRYLNMLVFTVRFLMSVPRRPRPTIVLGSSAHLLAALGAYMASRYYRVPFVLEIRDVWPDSLIQLGLSNRSVIRLLQAIEAFLYDRSHAIVAVSEGIADRISDKGVERSKIRVIAHGIRPSVAPTDEEIRIARRKRGWEGKTVAIWAGSLQPGNAVHSIIDAAEELQAERDLVFAIVGDGSERESLLQRSEGLPNVEVYPPVPKSEIREWLIASDIGLLTSRRFEAFTGVRPRKIFDYFSSKLPVVCTIPGEAWQLIEEAEAGVRADWEDHKSLGSAVLHLHRNPGERRTRGEAGFEAVNDTHSLVIAAENLAQLISVLASNSSNRKES